jgi:hypothetical protein
VQIAETDNEYRILFRKLSKTYFFDYGEREEKRI